MQRLVQKFGGSSVKDPGHIKRVAQIVADTFKQTKELVVVVSAMDDTTDKLIELAKQVSSDPEPRELDVLLATGEQVSIAMLALALNGLGLRARSFTGPQAGILTDDVHGFARIKSVQASRIEASIRRGEIPVVAGFQGMTRESELTTLGRGGSDTTAVALAAALKADCCDIYTDVDGIYTTDPRTVESARRLSAVSYQEMLRLASLGAQVLNARSVDLAMRKNVSIRLRSTFCPADTGTLVTSKAANGGLCGIACDADRLYFRLSLSRSFAATEPASESDSEESKLEPDLESGLGPEREKRMHVLLAELEKIGLDSISIEKTEQEMISELKFTCQPRLARQVQSVLAAALSHYPGSLIRVEPSVAVISLVGAELQSNKKVLVQSMKSMLASLQAASIPVSMLHADALSISAVVPEKHKDEAVREIHKCFFQPENQEMIPVPKFTYIPPLSEQVSGAQASIQEAIKTLK